MSSSSWIKSLFGGKAASSKEIADRIILFERQQSELNARYQEACQRRLEAHKRELVGQSSDGDEALKIRSEIVDLEGKLQALGQLDQELKEALASALEADRLAAITQAGKDVAQAEKDLLAGKRAFLTSLAKAIAAQEGYIGPIWDNYALDGRYPCIWPDILESEKAFYLAEIQKARAGNKPMNWFLEVDRLKAHRTELEQKQIGPADVDALLSQHRGGQQASLGG